MLTKALLCVAIAVPALTIAQDIRLDFLRVIESPQGVTNFGRNVQLLDDVNGDTFPDYAVAASSPAGGMVFLFSGFDGTLLRSFESPQEAIFIDAELQDTFAISMALLPDFTGDDIAELIIGAPHHAAPGAGPLDFESGVVYVLNPTNFEILYTLSSPSPIRDGQFGRAVDGFRANPLQAGSFRGILIGAPGEAGVPNGIFSNAFAGRAHVFDARTGLLRHTYINFTETQGEQATEGFFGFSVAAISNSNDLELFVAEPGANFSTETFLFTGRIYKYQGYSQTPLSSNPIRIITNSRVGSVMATAPDINRENGIGSGVVIGVPDSFPEDNTQNFGRVELKDFRGFSGQNTEYVSPTPQTNSRFGGAVAGILDVNGDGRGEIVVGQPLIGTDPDGELTDQAGFAHVFSAVSTTVLVSLPRPSEPQLRGGFGSSISGHRDSHAFLTRRRLLIGAPGNVFSQFPGGPQPCVYVYKMRTRLTGDINNSRIVDATDLSLLQRVIDGTLTVTQADILDVVDVNNDGVIDSNDYAALDLIVNGPADVPTGWTLE